MNKNYEFVLPELRRDMPRKSDEFAEYSFVEYPQSPTQAEVTYADPRFYASRQEDDAAPHTALSEPLPVEDTSHPQNEVELAGEYRGPENLERYTADVGAEQREAAENGQMERSRE